MFFDRHAAGIKLAQQLSEYKNQDVVLYALPKGGVPVAYEVAKALHLPLDIVIVQKICHPISREYGICAIAETGETVCYESGLCGLDGSWLNFQMYMKQQEAKRQRALYKLNQPSKSAENKIAIIIDDGISTGISIKAAIQAILSEWPEKIIVAAPVAPHETVRELADLVDQVVVLNDDREYRGDTSSYYVDFMPVTDAEVIAQLEETKDYPLSKGFHYAVGNRLVFFDRTLHGK
jgi:putative phosphoribosyl transferase